MNGLKCLNWGHFFLENWCFFWCLGLPVFPHLEATASGLAASELMYLCMFFRLVAAAEIYCVGSFSWVRCCHCFKTAFSLSSFTLLYYVGSAEMLRVSLPVVLIPFVGRVYWRHKAMAEPETGSCWVYMLISPSATAVCCCHKANPCFDLQTLDCWIGCYRKRLRTTDYATGGNETASGNRGKRNTTDLGFIMQAAFVGTPSHFLLLLLDLRSCMWLIIYFLIV